MKKDKDFVKEMEVYKELASTNEPLIVNELVIKEPQKGFYLIVRQPFDDYKKGDTISGFDAIEKVEKMSALNLCIKVNSNKGI
jgi:hypothetical protein